LKTVKRTISTKKKSTEINSNTAKNFPTKNTSEPQEKRDLAEKTIANLDKTVSGTT
jgi:hypothetical protein